MTDLKLVELRAGEKKENELIITEDNRVYLVGKNRRITLRDAKPGDKFIQRVCHDGTITLLPVTYQLASERKALEETEKA